MQICINACFMSNLHLGCIYIHLTKSSNNHNVCKLVYFKWNLLSLTKSYLNMELYDYKMRLAFEWMLYFSIKNHFFWCHIVALVTIAMLHLVLDLLLRTSSLPFHLWGNLKEGHNNGITVSPFRNLLSPTQDSL